MTSDLSGKTVWLGETKCAKCGHECKTLLHDAKHPTYGSWGVFCTSCFRSIGAKLGIGHGQKYRRNDEGRYVLEAGAE